ncbi:G5 and 3D domain-containing protein [Peribacillus alkalitolerans]|uniref:G5 and 3D domain-containing protein n=1 Tax=Peribacillus alkalitolerans TaxID=1550385 RepID=UPI0013D40CB6|nr:G5 and 3D domain-containing protein [Peribacillus alkalitolerans]
MKNLFSKSFKRRRLTIAISSLIVFIAVTGTMFYHGTKKTVAISIDGQEKIVKTHANTINDILKDLEIKVSAEDYLYPSGSTEVKDQLQVVWKPAKQITLIQNGKEKKIWTTAETVGELLKESKLEVKKEDHITPSLDTELQGNMKVAFEKSFLLHMVDGTKKVNQVWSTSTTVADFLKHQGIVLNELDRVVPGLQDYVQENGTVKIVRVEKVTDVVEEPINFAVISKKDSSLSKGKEKVVTEGKKGIKSKQFEVIKENGKEVKRTLLSEKILKEKQDQVVAVGTKVLVAQVSRGTSENSSGRELYVNSTAYTANCSGCSGVTATGYNLKNNPSAKVIAVDPSVIPLGTKVYVEGYGYAVAADTGSAIRGNKIDVFFSSKSQAYKWGVRKVKIRILN